MFNGVTDADGNIDIVFKDMYHNSVYDIYVTAAVGLIGADSYLMNDELVKHKVITTPCNKNIVGYDRVNGCNWIWNYYYNLYILFKLL